MKIQAALLSAYSNNAIKSVDKEIYRMHDYCLMQYDNGSWVHGFPSPKEILGVWTVLSENEADDL